MDTDIVFKGNKEKKMFSAVNAKLSFSFLQNTFVIKKDDFQLYFSENI